MKTKSLPALLIAGTMLAAGALSANAAVLTSFESSEGFVASSGTSAGGWTLPNNSRVRISDGTTEPAFLGTQSLRAVGGATNLTTANLAWAPPGDQLNVFSYSFITTATTFVTEGNAAWAYMFMYDSAIDPGLRNIQIRATYGTTALSDYRIQYAIGGGGASGFASINQADMNFSAWNTISTEVDFANNRFSISLNGTAVLSNIALTPGWTASAIQGTWLITPQDGTTTYYDAIAAVPEPSSAALLGIAGIALLSTGFRRKNRQLA